MDILASLVYGFSIALTPENLFWCLVGTAAGTVIGILPGLGSAATVALLLPVTMGINPASGLIMLAGVYYGSKYGGSTTSILLNTPGESSSVITAIDGYALARQGRAGAALGIAAIGSFIAGTVGVIGFTLFAPVVAQFAVSFGPAEYFALMFLGLTTVILLAGTSLIKCIISALFGLLLGCVGNDVISGQTRFTFGTPQLIDGFDLIVLMVGLFAISEVLTNVERIEKVTSVPTPNRLRDLLPTADDMKRSRFAFVQGSLLGFVIGILPGAGATVASFLSYGIEKRMSKTPERFGKGAIEGVAAPEAANNSETGGAMVPLLTLGIPGSGTTAILLAALLLWGLQPGPLLFTEHPEVVWPLVASMYIGNVMLLVLNLPLVPVFASLLRLPYYAFFPGILVIAVIGVYGVNFAQFDLLMLPLFGFAGYVMRKLDFPIAPVALAFVLGPLAESKLRLVMLMSGGDVSYLFTRPLAVAVLVFAAALLILPLFDRARMRNRILEEEV